jgi:hypothetical protein
MTIYRSKTKKYRIKEKTFSNNISEYTVEWKYLAWFGIFWNEDNYFRSFNMAKELINSNIEIDNMIYDRKYFTEKIL